MKLLEELKSIIRNDDWMMERLKFLHSLSIKDSWIGAGFIRNRIWDFLHNFPTHDQLNDIDVIYFDPVNLDPIRDKELEKILFARFPQDPWSVKNQARMHLKHGHKPYKNSEEALSHWVETPTCVAAKYADAEDDVQIIAPYGVEDLMELKVRPNPNYGDARKELYEQRISEKKWASKWPKLEIIYY